jgi:hypothetical protein
MSDTVDMFRDLAALKKQIRQKFGRPCQRCQVSLPKAHPKILLPQQWCRAHKPHWQDPRPELTQEDYKQL